MSTFFYITMLCFTCSLEDGSKKIFKDSKKIVTAINAQSRSCGKIGSDMINDLGENASDNLKEFELAMNKQAMLSADKVEQDK